MTLTGWQKIARELGDYDMETFSIRDGEQVFAMVNQPGYGTHVGEWVRAEPACREIERLRAELDALRANAAPLVDLAIRSGRDQADAEAQNLRAEVDRLRSVIRETHDNYCTADYTIRGKHSSLCLIHELEDIK